MSVISTIIEVLATRIIESVDRGTLGKIKMKLCRRIQTRDLSPTACELIVAVLEKRGAILETCQGVCIALGDRNELFASGIPEKERLPIETAIGELVDNRLVSKFTDKLYTATKKAWKNQKRLVRQDDVRVFLYAPEKLKRFYPLMAYSDAIIGIPFWNDTEARIEVRREGKIGFRGALIPRREAEHIFEYLWREKLLNEMWFTNQNGDRLFGLTIDKSLDLVAIRTFFGGDIPDCLRGTVSQRGRRVARININKLDEYVKSSVLEISQNSNS